ncbi:uncharacterized protein LOC130589540 [Beta vulgaris subsp. vulgaris]|uniref:uncharacterized protein LOC130589540 n=1 Tax=Beta vulgaris subsp. vulgaris TaxID=3555 RepID=UPI002548001B|nr:uncharacterized protein LOC130589540 [Beta vulgaris subsp. vulgaris]
MVFLMETKIDATKLQVVRDKCGFMDGLCLSSRGLSGGLGFWWRDVNARVVPYSAHHVFVEICDGNNVPVWAAVGIYGWPETENKHRTWRLMQSLKVSSPLPMVFFGDFNEILHGSEKDGGVARREILMDAFRETIEGCDLRDLGFRGSTFTWQRGNDPDTLIRERLDRFLASEDWCALFPYSWVRNFPIYKSDHAPILLSADVAPPRRSRKKLFYFEALWLSKPKCQEVVRQAWESEAGTGIEGRIAACAASLGTWAATTFGDLKKKVKDKEAELELWQNKPPDGVMLERCRGLVSELDELHRLEESYWHARSRVNELKDDKYRDVDGVLKTDEEEIGDVISNYFMDIFSSSSPSGFDDALAGLSRKVCDVANDALIAEPTRDEIYHALFQMHPNKAPGIDGMHALFYQKFWHIVGDDVVSCVQNWWHGNVDLQMLNKTCITLIPKCQHPIQMGDFRPISLCNVLYKVISKVMANRLKVILPDLISSQQSAFVPGRLITDNAMIAFEIFHYMKRSGDGRTGSMAFKLDMSKAYDRVEWSFLEKVMLKLGFCESWIRRVMVCLSSVTYSFKLNGKVQGNIIPSRGLRQGDPLSPYLFLLCAEAFSALLTRAAGDGKIHGARVCRSAPRISHLFFADDSILFARATLQECSMVADIISVYERASGQKINFNKSEVSFSKNVNVTRRCEIRNLFGVKEVVKHDKYLGLPTLIGRSKKAVFSVLKERVWKKLQGWKEKLLSKAGKEVLIKAVIQSIPTYMMSLFSIPEGILDDINSLCARFWWGGKGMEKKMHWVSWEKLCLPKSYGRMGFRDLRTFNQALLAKQGWRLMCDVGGLAHQVMQARYFKNDNFVDARRGYDPSFVWRSIWGAKSLLLEGLKWRVGNGANIRVWDMAWLPGDSVSVVPTPNVESPGDLVVADLIGENGCWDAEALSLHLTGGCGIGAGYSFDWITRIYDICESCLGFLVIRNSVVHADPWNNSQVGALGFLKLVTDYKAYAGAVFTRMSAATFPHSRGSWVPPPAAHFRVNTDAALLGDEGVGLGVVVRDELGVVRAVAVRRIRTQWTAALAEAMAAKFGLVIARNLGYLNVELESDALSLVKSVHGKMRKSSC